MSHRTPEQLAEDQAATNLATNLVNTMLRLRIDPHVAVNALAGALGAYVAITSKDEATAKSALRTMATQAREQMELQLRLRAMGEPVGHA